MDRGKGAGVYRLLFLSTLAAASLPEWLAVYPGAKLEVAEAPGMATATYVTAAKPDAVIAHYRKLWEAAGLPFAANFKGMGTSMRAALADCELLVQVREEGEGSQVKATCASRDAVADPNGAREVITSNGSVGRGRIGSRPAGYSNPNANSAAILAKAEADHRARTAKMGDFDKPVFPQPPRDPDGIPLRWPRWLVHMPGASVGLDVQETVQYKKRLLRSQFRTAKPMSQVFQYYEDLLNANGFKVGVSRLETGQTISGVIQNKSGMVNGRWEPNGVGRGGMSVEVRFSRAQLNEPIRVVLDVQLIQIYSNR